MSDADLLITGRVATLEGTAGLGWREAIAIRDGVVVATGSGSELEAVAGRRTRRWRLPPGLAVLPGITDAHLHLATAAMAELQLDLSATRDLREVLASVRDAHERQAAAGDDDGWMLGHGWSLDRLGSWPTAEMLETAAPGRPVALYAHDHHSRWVSVSALRLAGIGGATPDPRGGLVRRDDAGRPTGVLHEGAVKLVDGAIPPPRREELAEAIASYAGKLAALGITGCHDPGEVVDEPALARGPTLYRWLAAAGRLPLRVHSSVRAVQLGRAIELGLRSGDGLPMSADDDRRLLRLAARYRMGWLKLFADGSLGSRSAALLEPYDDAAEQPPTGDPRGMLLQPPAELAADVRRAREAGIEVQVHAIGDRAVRLALDLLTDPGRPALALRPRVEHAQLVHPADVWRFSAGGVAASVQPVHIRADAGPARRAWGARSSAAFPLAALDVAGTVMPFGTDAPVESPDPWPGVALAIARRDLSWAEDEPPFHPEQALDPARAIRAACLDPALAAGDRQGGRLLAGYRADLTVVPLGDSALAAGELARLRPLATLIDGESVYHAPDFDP